MKYLKSHIIFLLILFVSASAYAQSNLSEYKQQQKANYEKFKQEYYNNIAALDQLYKTYINQEKEMYGAFKNLGYIPEKVVHRINILEKMFPKQSDPIPIQESENQLKLTIKTWNEKKNKANPYEKNLIEILDIPDEIIPLENEEDLIVEDIVKSIEIAPSDNTANVSKELKMELEANRPVYCPLPKESYRISSAFSNKRRHPVLFIVRKHEGVDLAAPRGTPVYAAANGVVKISKYSRSAGKYIIVNHENGYTTSYMHLSKRLAKNGQKVKRGQLIGYVGTTGISTGNHLHYEIRKNGDAYNPEPFMIAFFLK